MPRFVRAKTWFFGIIICTKTARGFQGNREPSDISCYIRLNDHVYLLRDIPKKHVFALTNRGIVPLKTMLTTN